MRTGRVTPPDRDGSWLPDPSAGSGDNGDDGATEDGLSFGATPLSAENALRIGNVAYAQASTWLDMAYRQQWEDGLRLFNGEHIHGSKYHDREYAGRSRLFRPKTRSVIKRGEAAIAAAFFATSDQVNITPVNSKSPYGRASADFYGALLNHRLRKTIRWFLTVVGAYQSAAVQGACFTKQYWRYELAPIGKRPVTVKHPETGQPMVDPQTGRPQVELEDGPDGVAAPKMEQVWGVAVDEPACDPIRPENIRIDQSADWRDPVNTSSFCIVDHPMTILDVKRRMELRNEKTGQPIWNKVDDGVLIAAKITSADITNQARQGNDRPDPDSQGRQIFDHEIICVREFFFRHDGIDWQWFQVGSQALLTEPAPTRERYPHCKPGERPVVMGILNVESFVVLPRSKVNLGAPLQFEANDLANLRIDGLRLSLQPRAKVVAGRVINPDALRRFDPGEPLLVNKIDDMEWDKPPSVDAAAYAEQDRINNDYDELMGNFSSGSVMTNRKMNETVGGMELLSNAANTVSEYELRTFSETWFERVMNQMLRLEQMYETDTVIMGLAADSAKLAARHGVSDITDELLDQECVVNVNVGVGATDPNQQLDRFMKAFMAFVQILTPVVQAFGPQALQSPGAEAIAEEIFGKIGYKDCERFMDFGPPQQPNQGQGADPAQLQNDLMKEKMRGDTAVKIAAMGHEAKQHSERMKGFAALAGQHMKNTASAQEAEKGRTFQAGESTKDRSAAGDQARAKAAAGGGKGGGTNVVPMTPMARRFAEPGGAQPPAAGGGDQPQHQQPAAHPPVDHRAHIEALGHTMDGARTEMMSMQSMLAGFVKQGGTMLRQMHEDVAAIADQVRALQDHAMAPRSIVKEGGKRFIQIGNQRREITKGANGSLTA